MDGARAVPTEVAGRRRIFLAGKGSVIPVLDLERPFAFAPEEGVAVKTQLGEAMDADRERVLEALVRMVLPDSPG